MQTRSSAGALLRYKADRKTLTFVAIYFSLVAYQWIYSPRDWWLAAPLLFATCVFSFFGAVATHNTVHAPVFHKRSHNRLFQIILSLTYGHPVSAFVPGHNLSHHRYTQSRRDVMRTSKARFRYNLLNLFLFMPKLGGDLMAADMRYAVAMRKRNPVWFQQFCIEWAVFLSVSVALLATDWKKFIFYILIPHQYAAWGIVTMNLLQHDGTDENTEYNHSRNFVGKTVNWWVYNNGYHTIHHHKPGLHWSLAPEAHAREIAPHIHPNLDQKSLLAYVWTTFVMPGGRQMYDGRPFVLPDVGEDEEWIPAPSEVPDVSLGAISAT